jgi:hypothetical protein
MKALSVRQPWAWAIIHAGKDIENWTWRTHYRGEVAIHASSKMDESGREMGRPLDYYLTPASMSRFLFKIELRPGRSIKRRCLGITAHA